MVTYNPSVKGWNFPMQEAAEREQRKRCHEQRLLNTVSPTVLQSSPAFGWKVKKKKSDNGVTVLPSQAMLLFLTPRWAVLAPGRHRLGLPPVAGKPKGKGERSCCFPRDQDPHTGAAASGTFPHGTGAGRSGQLLTLPHLFTKNPKPATWIGSLLFVQLLAYYSRKTTKVCQESAIS